MPSAKNKRNPKVVDSKVTSVRNLKREIKQAEKKTKKLLLLWESEKKRWKWKKNKKVEINKNQGIAPDSERHKALLSHIDKMKARLKQLSS